MCGPSEDAAIWTAAQAVPRTNKKYELKPCDVYGDEWLVECILADGDVMMTRFSGPYAKERATGHTYLLNLECNAHLYGGSR